MKAWTARLFYGILFAIPLMLLSYALAQASPQEQVSQPQTPDCAQCHSTFQETWEQGAHSKATSNPIFQADWKMKGEPEQCLSCHTSGYNSDTGTYMAEGITCQACHKVEGTSHPVQPIPVDRSSQLCGTCHTETYYEWQVSQHREKGLDCISCHDPHASSLKSESSAVQCSSCHRERSDNFSHSGHSEKGLVCADCHMTTLTDDVSEGHARRDHSFNVLLSTCNQCHQGQMHDAPHEHENVAEASTVDALASDHNLTVNAEPKSAGPVGFASLAGLIGLAAGIIVGPTLERRFRKAHSENEEN